MTEKRYYCNENFVVIDSKTEKSCSYFKCMNLLNKREKEIKKLKETIVKITIAYQRKHDNTIVNLIDEVWEEDISDLIKNGDME